MNSNMENLFMCLFVFVCFFSFCEHPVLLNEELSILLSLADLKKRITIYIDECNNVYHLKQWNLYLIKYLSSKKKSYSALFYLHFHSREAICVLGPSSVYYPLRFGIPYHYRRRSHFWSPEFHYWTRYIMHLCRCNSGSLPCYSFWLSFARYDYAVNGSGQCTYAKSNDYIPLGDTRPFGTGEMIFCSDQEPLAIKWVQCWSSSFYLLPNKEINSKDTVETLLMKNSLIWTTVDFFMGSSLGLKDLKYTNFHTFTTSMVRAPLKSAPFCFRKRFDRLYHTNEVKLGNFLSNDSIAREIRDCTWQNCNPRWMWHGEQKYAFVYFVRSLSRIDNSQ